MRDKIIGSEDRGQALIIVVGIALALILFATALIGILGNRFTTTSTEVNKTVAQANAQLGLATFISGLNVQSNWPEECLSSGLCGTFQAIGNGGSYYAISMSPSNFWTTCLNNATQNPPPPCNVTVTSNGIVLRPSNNPSKPLPKTDQPYNNSLAGYNVAGTATESINVTLPNDSYLNFIYYTNFETADPADNEVYSSSINISQATAEKICPYHMYQLNSITNSDGPDYSGNNCVQIQFGSGDTINGPLFTNDLADVCGGNFTGAFEVGFYNGPVDPNTYNTSNNNYPPNPPYLCGGGTFAVAPTVATFIPPPANLSNPATLARIEGCIYSGPTFITLHPQVGNSVVATVVSPDTKAFPGGLFMNSLSGQACGTPGNSTATSQSIGSCGLASKFGCNVNICTGATTQGCKANSTPFDGVFYAENSPTSTADPNYWSESIQNVCAHYNWRGKCTKWVKKTVDSAPTCNSEPYNWTIQGEGVVPSTAPFNNPIPFGLNCLLGDALVQGDPSQSAYTNFYGTQQEYGAFDGRLTISSQDNIIVVGHLVYNDDGGTFPTMTNFGSNQYDALGLVANNFVEINNPNCSTCSNIFGFDSTCSPGQTAGCTVINTNMAWPTVDAGIMAANHSFTVNNWGNQTSGGNDSTNLTVNGSIVQDFRGIVATFGGSGYVKNYNYDSNMQTQSNPNDGLGPPPGWPSPSWQISSVSRS